MFQKGKGRLVASFGRIARWVMEYGRLRIIGRVKVTDILGCAIAICKSGP